MAARTSTYVENDKKDKSKRRFQQTPLMLLCPLLLLYCSSGLRHPCDAPCTPQATLLAEKHGLKVCIIDPNLEKRWIPNYGVLVEEWEALDKDLQVPVMGFPGSCVEEAEREGGRMVLIAQTMLHGFVRYRTDEADPQMMKRCHIGVNKARYAVLRARVGRMPVQAVDMHVQQGSFRMCQRMYLRVRIYEVVKSRLCIFRKPQPLESRTANA